MIYFTLYIKVKVLEIQPIVTKLSKYQCNNLTHSKIFNLKIKIPWYFLISYQYYLQIAYDYNQKDLYIDVNTFIDYNSEILMINDVNIYLSEGVMFDSRKKKTLKKLQFINVNFKGEILKSEFLFEDLELVLFDNVKFIDNNMAESNLFQLRNT